MDSAAAPTQVVGPQITPAGPQYHYQGQVQILYNRINPQHQGNPRTPNRGNKNKNRGTRGKARPNSSTPPYNCDPHHIPTANRYEPLGDHYSGNGIYSPRPLLGRGRGTQQRGQGPSSHRGQPPQPYPPMNAGYRETQGRNDSQRTGQYLQSQGSRREEGAAEQDPESRKIRRVTD